MPCAKVACAFGGSLADLRIRQRQTPIAGRNKALISPPNVWLLRGMHAVRPKVRRDKRIIKEGKLRTSQ